MWLTYRMLLIPSWLDPTADAPRRRFWILAGGTFLLHAVLDPLITYLLVRVYEVGREANPLFIEPLNAGLGVFVVSQMPLVINFGLILVGYSWLLHIGSPAEVDWLYRFATLMWVITILWGIALVGNNLLVLITGLI